jgi:hypothetical protein
VVLLLFFYTAPVTYLSHRHLHVQSPSFPESIRRFATTDNSFQLDSASSSSSIIADTLHNAAYNQTSVAYRAPRALRPASHAIHVSASRSAQNRGNKEQPSCR